MSESQARAISEAHAIENSMVSWFAAAIAQPGNWLMLVDRPWMTNTLWIAGIDLGIRAEGNAMVRDLPDGQSRVVTVHSAEWTHWCSGRYDGSWTERPLEALPQEVQTALRMCVAGLGVHESNLPQSVSPDAISDDFAEVGKGE